MSRILYCAQKEPRGVAADAQMRQLVTGFMSIQTVYISFQIGEYHKRLIYKLDQIGSVLLQPLVVIWTTKIGETDKNGSSFSCR
jgi:hypothetical protein